MSIFIWAPLACVGLVALAYVVNAHRFPKVVRDMERFGESTVRFANCEPEIPFALPEKRDAR